MEAIERGRSGANGDPLPAGKLDLPELRETPTAEDWAWARAFIGRRRWREAVTYRETAPHAYTVRDWMPEPEDQRDFERFVTQVRRFGYAGYFQRSRYLYWVVDGLKYWTMGWPVAETTVINRAAADRGGSG